MSLNIFAKCSVPHETVRKNFIFWRYFAYISRIKHLADKPTSDSGAATSKTPFVTYGHPVLFSHPLLICAQIGCRESKTQKRVHIVLDSRVFLRPPPTTARNAAIHDDSNPPTRLGTHRTRYAINFNSSTYRA